MSTAVLQHRPIDSAARPGLRVVRIALAGCGVVGSELARLIGARGRDIETQYGVSLQIVGVLVRDLGKPRAVPLSPALFTDDVDRFLAQPADIVVEAIGGIAPAGRIAHTALARGARLVTANKALLAESGDALLALATARGSTIDFEAAVGGGVPIVRALRSSLRNAPVRRVQAILNGTTNYILTRIERGASFQDALVEAQTNGFAEADPSRDLDGRDAADKLRVLAWLAFGVAPRAVPVACRGIVPDAEELVRAARAHGDRVRLIATCERDASGHVVGKVQPEFVAPSSPFGSAVDEQNVITVDFGWSQPLTLSGPGAGALPTASALLGDVLCS